jgi:hypothetical protein
VFISMYGEDENSCLHWHAWLLETLSRVWLAYKEKRILKESDVMKSAVRAESLRGFTTSTVTPRES